MTRTVWWSVVVFVVAAVIGKELYEGEQRVNRKLAQNVELGLHSESANPASPGFSIEIPSALDGYIRDREGAMLLYRNSASLDIELTHVPRPPEYRICFAQRCTSLSQVAAYIQENGELR